MMRPAPRCAVDLVVTCFERTIEKVLAPGFFSSIEADNKRRFERRTALINNVRDRSAAESLARERVRDREIDAFAFVEDSIDASLAKTGLDASVLRPVPHFIDWGLVAVTLDGPELMLHWDADVRLAEPVDWIGDAVELLAAEARVMVVNPNWEVDNLRDFTLEENGPFALGHGFSDQVFLVRRSDFGHPIYQERCVARWRYPFPSSFEARVDAHLRHSHRLRATHRGGVYLHEVAMGTSWLAGRSLADRARAAGRHATIAALRRSPWRPAHLKGL